MKNTNLGEIADKVGGYPVNVLFPEGKSNIDEADGSLYERGIHQFTPTPQEMDIADAKATAEERENLNRRPDHPSIQVYSMGTHISLINVLEDNNQ